MENDGIIYISSGDEVEREKVSKNGIPLQEEDEKDSSEVEKPNNACKVENDIDNNQIADSASQKRKASQMNDCKSVLPSLVVNKKIKISAVEGALNQEDSLCPNTETEDKTIDKPKLIVKEKRSLPQVNQDTFPQFISLCLQKDRSEDMKVIVNKLKRRYEQLEPSYATSETFITFLNEKRNSISTSNKKLYVHIADVMNEMKRMCKKDDQPRQTDASNNSIEKRSIVSKLDHLDGCKSRADDNNEEEYGGEDRKTSKELRMLLKVMRKCEKRIAELEEEEVDFNEEIDSSYMKVERYKRRIVELWYRYCKLTGENPDAGRPYLRPKHLSATRIVAVDQAITNFINSQISQKNKLSKIGAHVNALIFPDYADILECISKCNESHNLGLDKKKQQQIAKRAFTELGDHLQRVRRNDYWDTFSLFLENKEDDPASKNVALAEALNQNRRIGEKKLSQVFEDFVRKQDQRKTVGDESTSSGTEDEESVSGEGEVEDEEEDEVDISGEEDISDTDTEDDGEGNASSVVVDGEITPKKRMSADNEKSDGSKQEVRRKSAEGTTATLSAATDKKDSDIILSDEESNKSAKDSEKGSARENDSGAKAKNELTSEAVIIKSKNTDGVPNANGAVQAKSENRTQTPETSSKEIPVKSRKELSSRQSPVTVCRTAAKGTEETVAVSVSDESKSKTDSNSEEEKPVLRVRSFAKPPTTWEDERQETDKANGTVLNMLKNQRILVRNGRKKPSNRNTSIPDKLPDNAIESVVGMNGNQTAMLLLPTTNREERSPNEKNTPKEQNRLITQYMKTRNAVPILITNNVPVRNVILVKKSCETVGNTSK